jgi:hypothetical protein
MVAPGDRVKKGKSFFSSFVLATVGSRNAFRFHDSLCSLEKCVFTLAFDFTCRCSLERCVMRVYEFSPCF